TPGSDASGISGTSTPRSSVPQAPRMSEPRPPVRVARKSDARFMRHTVSLFGRDRLRHGGLGRGRRGRLLLDDAALLEELGDVELLDAVLEALALEAVGEHRHAERARARDGACAGVDELQRALHVHAVLVLLLHPHLRAAGAAAEAARLGPVVRLDELDAGDLAQDLARGLVDVVVATEVAAVVIDD